MYPEQAICLLTGTYTKLVIFGISPAVANYRGKFLIHTLGYYDDIEDPALQAEFKAGSLQVVNAAGLNEDTFPGHAIQGWVNVVDVMKYDADSFAADQDDHGQGDNLAVYRDELYLTEEAEAWCFVVSEPIFLEKAIQIKAPPETYEADLWFPESPEEIESFRDALNQVVVVEEVAD